MDLVKSVDGQFVFLVFLASFVWGNFTKIGGSITETNQPL